MKHVNGYTFHVGSAFDVIRWDRRTDQPSFGQRITITEIRLGEHGDVMADDGNEGCLIIWAHMLKEGDLQPAGQPLPRARS